MPDNTSHCHLSNVTDLASRVAYYNYPTTGLGAVLSRLDNIAADSSGTSKYVQYTYLGAGTIIKEEHPAVSGGLTLSYGTAANDYSGLDRFGRIASQTWTNASGTTTLDGFTYTYDRAGNPLTKTNSLNSSFSEAYTYDALNRLVDANRNGTNLQDWTLDSLGNWSGTTIGTTGQTRTKGATMNTMTASTRSERLARLGILRESDLDPNTGMWRTPDTLGYVDGGDVYEYVRCNPVCGVDPLGLAVAQPTPLPATQPNIAAMSIKIDHHKPLRTTHGSAEIEWEFNLEKPVAEDRFFVQEVTVIYDYCDKDGKKVPRPSVHFWEAMPIKKGSTTDVGNVVKMPNGLFAEVPWTDIWKESEKPDTKGKILWEATVKFYTKTQVAPNDPATWKPGKDIGLPSGDLKSSKTAPAWWKDAPTAGPNVRSVICTWEPSKINVLEGALPASATRPTG